MIVFGYRERFNCKEEALIYLRVALRSTVVSTAILSAEQRLWELAT
jgi:hypothetical protein